MNRLEDWMRPFCRAGRAGHFAMWLLTAIAVAGCMHNVTYAPEFDPATAKTLASLRNLPRPLRLMVMPLTLQPASNGREANAANLELEESFRQTFNAALDAQPNRFERVPLPVGAEADAVIRHTMANQTDSPAPAELATVKAFALADYFLYCTATLNAPSASPETRFTVDLRLRLVDRQSLAYIPVTACGQGSTTESAMQQAIAQSITLLSGQ